MRKPAPDVPTRASLRLPEVSLAHEGHRRKGARILAPHSRTAHRLPAARMGTWALAYLAAVCRALVNLATGLALLLAIGAQAGPIDPRFSIDPASPAIGAAITPDDVLKAGPVVHIQGTNLGLQDAFSAGVFDNLADFSFGKDPIQDPLYFSVDRVAIGLPGTAVFDQASPAVASAAGDVYRALPPFGSNQLYIEETTLGLTPGFFGDDIDGLELDTEPAPNTYFAIDRLSATNGFGAGTLASGLLVSPGNGSFGIYATFAQIGLDPFDAIDGLILLDRALDQSADPGVDIALFSLDPFSPDTFTFTGLPYLPCVPGHMSPADVCVTTFTGTFALWASAPDIGLRPDDNVDALDTVPEPTTSSLLGVALLFLFVARRRATRRSVVQEARS